MNEKKFNIPFCYYFCELFARSTMDLKRFRREFLSLMPHLRKEVIEQLECPISENGAKWTINNLNPGKSPGPDGLRAAFYKAMKDRLTNPNYDFQ